MIGRKKKMVFYTICCLLASYHQLKVRDFKSGLSRKFWIQRTKQIISSDWFWACCVREIRLFPHTAIVSKSLQWWEHKQSTGKGIFSVFKQTNKQKKSQPSSVVVESVWFHKHYTSHVESTVLINTSWPPPGGKNQYILVFCRIVLRQFSSVLQHSITM